MIPRLTPPKIVKTDSLPRFGQVCRAASEPQQQGEEPVLFSTVANELTLSSLFDHSSSSSSTAPLSIPRAIFVGEQHHQPKVLAAQLQIIYQLFQACEEGVNIHVVFEQWSLLDQPYLNTINAQDASSPNFQASSSEVRTSEGFDATHYLPIVKLVRELGGTVWGGFPPRSWAQMVSKAKEDDTAFETIQQLDQQRYTAHSRDSTKIISPLSVADYHLIEEVSWPHRTYLKSMFRPDERPQILAESTAEGDPPKEAKGFLPAQAIKDTFLAHTMSNILAQDPKNVVLAVTGLGHCEWGFGAPERLKKMTGIDSHLIMTKPDDSGYWTSLPVEQNKAPTATSSSAESNRKQADAIILYNWVD
jgi:uncharacterized iron-regulated protein